MLTIEGATFAAASESSALLPLPCSGSVPGAAAFGSSGAVLGAGAGADGAGTAGAEARGGVAADVGSVPASSLVAKIPTSMARTTMATATHGFGQRDVVAGAGAATTGGGSSARLGPQGAATVLGSAQRSEVQPSSALVPRSYVVCVMPDALLRTWGGIAPTH